jgi:hypothetical protein
MKRLFTFLMLIGSVMLLNAQIVISDELVIADFEGDDTSWDYALESSWGTTAAEVADNPSKSGLNESDKVFMTTREAGGWNSAIKFAWTSEVTVGERNFLRVKVYAADQNTFVYLKLISNDAVVKEGWAGMPAQTNDQWGYAVLSLEGVTAFDKIEIYLSDNWGTNNAEKTAYVDDLELYKEAYNYQDAFMDMVYMAPKTTVAMDIDGLDLEDVWLDAEYAPIEKIAAGDGVGISGEWASVWDDDYLYLFFMVDDDVIWKWSDADWADWKGDGFQLYMDALARRIDGRTFGNLSGFGVSPDRESQGAIDAGSGYLGPLGGFGPFQEDAIQASIISGTGYTIEVAYPWEAIAYGTGAVDSTEAVNWAATEVAEGLQIAFDVQLNDDDGAGRVNMVSWASEPKEPYGNSGTWGGLELAGAVGIETAVAKSNLNVYPSITNGLLNIQMQNMKSIEIFDISGKVIISRKVNSENTQLDVSSLQNGIYIIKANDGETHFVHKFIKQ